MLGKQYAHPPARPTAVYLDLQFDMEVAVEEVDLHVRQCGARRRGHGGGHVPLDSLNGAHGGQLPRRHRVGA